MIKRAIIAGAAGLVGGELLNILLEAPGCAEVLILVRRELNVKHPKLTQLVVDFDKLQDYSALLTGEVIFCCLGSTRKKTPDLDKYRKVDHDYPLRLAEIGLQNKIAQYHLVSAMGANPGSANFYTKMKGETESDVIAAGLPATHIYRPSFLVGDRNENRPLEAVLSTAMKIIDPLLFGGLKKYRSIAAKTVASAMYKQSLKNEPGVHVYLSDKIKELS